MARQHTYHSRTVWTGNLGAGTASYRGYDRTWQIAAEGTPPVSCSNDPLLGGDPTLHNPETLLLSSLSACHMLWYLHLAAKAGIVVTAYQDDPEAQGETAPNGAGRFLSATLKPQITVAAGTDIQAADAIHGRIHEYCFIARSVNFPVKSEARYEEGPASPG